MTLRSKILFISTGLVILSTLGIATLNILTTRKAMIGMIESKLTGQATIIESDLNQFAESTLNTQAKIVRDSIEQVYSEYQRGRLSQDERDALIRRLIKESRFSRIGSSGYMTVLNSGRRFIYHPYSEGGYLTDTNAVRLIYSTTNGFFEYPYKNPGETGERSKIAGEAYFRPLDYFILATAYKNDFIEMFDNYSFSNIIVSSRISSNSYALILSDDGKRVIAPFGREDQYEDIDGIADTEGRHFYREILSGNRQEGFLHLTLKQDGKAQRYVTFFRHLPVYKMYIVSFVPERDAYRTVSRTLVQSGVTLAIFLAISLVITLFVSRSIMRIVNNINGKITNISSGTEKADLSKRIEIQTKDELGGIVDGVNSMLSRLNRDMLKVRDSSTKLQETSSHLMTILDTGVKHNVSNIRENIQTIDRNIEDQTSGVEEVNATLEEIARNIESISANISRQVAGVEEVASSMEEMSRNIEIATSTTNRTRDISKNLNAVAAEGTDAVKKSVVSIRDVSEYSKQILKMLKLITDISKQTNLLAMNASIEAAHAGEAGKGFAIVADEIRRLAENTSKNAKDIGDVVNSIVTKIEESVALAERAGTGLEMILTYSSQNMQMITQFSTTMEEQNHSAKEILVSTADMVQITEDIKLSMQEQKGGIEEFGETMRSLRDMSIDTKDSIKNHISNLNELIASLDEIRSIAGTNSELSGSLFGMIGDFVLDDKENDRDENTGMKLVE